MLKEGVRSMSGLNLTDDKLTMLSRINVMAENLTDLITGRCKVFLRHDGTVIHLRRIIKHGICFCI